MPGLFTGGSLTLAGAISRPCSLSSARRPTSGRGCSRMTGAIASAAGGKEKRWIATITSTAPVVDETTGSHLQLIVVDKHNQATSVPAEVDGQWERFEMDRDGKGGWARRGQVVVPAELDVPGAVLVRKLDHDATDGAHTVDYIRNIKLATHDGVYEFPAGSWVSSDHGQRAFFEGTAYLPKDTPETLQDERKKQLEELRGVDGPGPKNATDRAFAYQRYDDLGTADLPRPALGGSAELPYPRHLSNNRAVGVEGPGKPWLPFDEQFDASKKNGFNGGLLSSIGPAVAQLLTILPNRGFKDFEDVYELFRKERAAGSTTGDESVWDMQLDERSMSELDEKVERSRLGPLGRIHSKLVEALDLRKSSLKVRDLFKFDPPRVLEDRPGVWDSDAEYGRQVLAGMNPCALTALKQMPEAIGSAIRPEHVDGELAALGGADARTMEQLVAEAAEGRKPRLFLIDYWVMDTFWAGKDQKATAGRQEHAGRALFYLQQSSDGEESALIPIAIELKNEKTHERDGGDVKASSGVVYSRYELVRKAEGQKDEEGQKALWKLAKAVFRSVDSAYHQLVSHWLRCHCCMEPMLIALRRQLSAMHPVHKLMLPHFRYTLDINSKARSSLISAGGIIETTFTAGAYAMRLSSIAYKDWRFHLQALPEDLKARGMSTSAGEPWLKDYPYAEDGLQIWQELETYFGAYLRLYYSSDSDVAGDEELQAWWAEVKNEGHPDLKLVEPDEAKVWGFAGAIPTIDALVRVLVTIAWTTSGHHAAVNFGQYDYGALILNASSLVRRPIPRPADTADPAYQALMKARGAGIEEELLTYLISPLGAITEMVTVNLLSIHAEDEQTLDERNTWLTDPAAVAENTKFMERMEALESRFQDRNQQAEAWTRYKERPTSLEYTLLVPGSPAGLTMKGVPYSVSI